MKYTLTITRDGELKNTIVCEKESKVFKELGLCYMNLTRYGYARKGTLTDRIVDGVHVDIFDLEFDSGAGIYKYHYEFDFSLRG